MRLRCRTMELQGVMLCDSASVKGNRISVLGGGLDAAYAPSFPTQLHAYFAAVLRFDWLDHRQPRHTLTLTCRDESGAQVGEFTIIVTLGESNLDCFGPDDVSILPVAIPLADLTLPATGNYEIALAVDELAMTSLPLRVLQAES